MQSMTIEQLRAASDAGGVEGVTLKGQGGAFLVQIATRSGPLPCWRRPAATSRAVSAIPLQP